MKKTFIIFVLILCILSGCKKNSTVSDISVPFSSYETIHSYITESVPSSEESSTEAVSSMPTVQPEKPKTESTVSKAQSVVSKTESAQSTVSKTESKPQEIIYTVAKCDISYGMWLSYIEINTLLKNSSAFKKNFETIVNNLVKLNISDLYIHVRSHCDSLYSSSYFPLRKYAKNYNYDVFKYMVDRCHKSGIRVHAWINPYRVSATSDDIATLDSNSPAFKWLKDSNPANDKNVIIKNGIFLNPAEVESRQLVVNGVKEIVRKYSVDGIHFDDYFYPSTDTEIDKISYESYCNATETPLELADWRRANVDALISDCKTAIKSSGKNIIFSISPAANIEKNYNNLYADIGGWIQKGYIDEVIPQLYFGFNHTDSDYNFDKLITDWKTLCEANKNVKLSIGLAAYKIGTASKTDGTEWQENSDILARQTKLCLDDPQISGAVYFSYSSLFDAKIKTPKELENLMKVQH